MQEVQARYEFRAFAQNFGLVEEKMRKLSKFEKFRESSEIYILSAANNEHNIKIRYDTLDIKVVVKEEQGRIASQKDPWIASVSKCELSIGNQAHHRDGAPFRIKARQTSNPADSL